MRRGAAVRARHARVQRDRRAAIVFAGRGGGGAARAGLQPPGGPIDPLQLRNGGAFPALLRGPGHFAVRGRPQAALRGSLGPQGDGREGRRPDGQPDLESAGRGEFTPPRRRGREESARGHANRHRGAALFPVEVHAQYGDRLRPAGGVELRGGDRAVRAILGGARAQHSAQAGRARRADPRLRQRTRCRGHGAPARQRRFLADAAGGIEGGCGGGEGGGFRRTGPRGQVRLPTGAGVQQFLPEVPDPDRTGSREEGIPTVDDGFLPASTGAYRVDPGDSDSRVHVEWYSPQRRRGAEISADSCATGRGASGPAGWVLTRRRGGAEKEAEKQGKEGAKFTRSQGGGASGERGGRRPSSARLKPAPQLASQHFLQGREGDGPGDAGSV